MLYHGQKAKYGHHSKNNHHKNPDRLDENKEYKVKPFAYIEFLE